MKVTLHSVSRSFGDVRAVDGADLVAGDGQVVALIGPSGCGKSTLLRLIAGFERPERGTIHVGGRLVAGPGVHIAPERRGVGLVFQADALFPHRRVAGNVAFGLPRAMGSRSRRARVSALLEMVGLRGLERRFPHELSGGQRQRVALARALAPEPAVILLDEPFAHLDAQLRSEIRAEVRGILRAAGATAILVTHDRTEALTMGDRVAVMIGGRVRQAGTAEEVYRHPADAEVGRLLGDADLLPGRAEHGEIVTEAGRLRPAVAPEVSGPVSVLLRPDNLRLTARADASAEVVERTFLGGEIRCTVRMASGVMVRCRAPASSGLDVGTRVSIVPTGEPVAWFPGERREAGRPAVAPISAPA